MLAPGSLLAGRYQVHALLEAGGMGEVYRARDQRLRRDVALKVLPSTLTRHPEALGRFEREAQALAALSHPNILTVHDSGVEGEVAFIVTELLDGENLRQRLARGPVPWPTAAAWGAHFAHALSAAHSRGVVHRDLKPENVFLTFDQGVKVLDFGLAELGRAEPLAPLPAGEPGPAPVGTTEYMAPELFRGASPDPRTDIFALGCLLFECVAGRRPFARPTVAQTIAALGAGQAPQPTQAFLRAPAWLRQAILRCLCLDPAGRFQSARELLRALDPATARPAAPPRRRRVLVAAGLAAAAAALLGPAAWLRAPHASLRRVTSLAVLPFAADGGAADYVVDGLTETTIARLARQPHLRVMARSTVFRFKGRELLPAAVGRELQVDSVLVGRVAQRPEGLVIDVELVESASGARAWASRFVATPGELALVEERLTRALERALGFEPGSGGRADGGLPDPEAHRLCLRARHDWNKRTQAGFKRAVEYFQQALDRDPNYAAAYAGLADSYALLGAFGFVPPGEAMPKARAAARRALAIDEGLAEAHASLGLAHLLYDWDWLESERQFRRAVELQPGYATAHHWYAELLSARGRRDEALAQLQMAAELDPLSASIATDRGRALYFARRHDEAAAQLTKVLESEPDFVYARICLGLVEVERKRYEAALRQYDEVARLAGEQQALVLRARVHALAGNRAEAERCRSELVAASASRYVSPFSLAAVHLALGDHERAFEWLGRALDERSEWLVYLRVDPSLDPLRGDPRFQHLLEGVGLAR